MSNFGLAVCGRPLMLSFVAPIAAATHKLQHKFDKTKSLRKYFAIKWFLFVLNIVRVVQNQLKRFTFIVGARILVKMYVIK